MNARGVFHFVSLLVMVIGLAVGVCWMVSIISEDPLPTQRGFALSCAAIFLAGFIIWVLTRGEVELSRRDGIGIVTFGWTLTVLTGAIPFMLSGVITNPWSALFESVSGFTTTGASVLTDLESLPRGILFWRALTQFLGGMGILILCVAILPLLGVGGMQIYRAEVTGPAKDRLTPRIASTAKLLWGVYIILNVVEIGLLKLGGMSWFDSVCHAFTTISTGGYSTRTQSIAAYNSVYIESVITLFMFLGGVNFALHFRAMRGAPLNFFRDAEFRFYLACWALACVAVMWNIWSHGAASLGRALRDSVFTCTAIMTTTGFSTSDYDQWPALSKIILVLLMFLGGCAGSTAGGIKCIRILTLIKTVLREIRIFLQPQGVYQVRLGKQLVEQEIVSVILVFFFIYMALFVIGTFVMCAFTPDLASALSSVCATLGNVGPGLSSVGPMMNYAAVPDGGKIVLILCMLLGRLEIYTFLAVLMPGFWKK